LGIRPPSWTGDDRFDEPGRDELTQRGFGDADVSADPDEPDAPFRDEPPGEPFAGRQDFGGLGDGQQPVGGCRHGASLLRDALEGSGGGGGLAVGAGHRGTGERELGAGWGGVAGSGVGPGVQD
jgi:hypothetical protein